MAYVGQPLGNQTLSTASQRLSGDGASLTFTLNQAIGKSSDVIIFVGTTYQIPEVDYTANGVNLIVNVVKAPTVGNYHVVVVFVAVS